MKEDFTLNFIFYLFSFLFRFIGIFILTGSFLIDPAKKYIAIDFADIARYLSCHKLVTLFKITNRQYIVISLIIFAIFILQIFFYFIKIFQYKNSDTKEEMIFYKIQIIIEHLIFLFFPFIIDFLVFILYMELLPDKFVIKKYEENDILNIIITVLNTVLIIGFNLISLIHIISINQQGNEKDAPIKYRFSKRKFAVFFLMQNFILLAVILIYLENITALKTFRICIFILIGIIFIGLFFSSIRKFNYPTKINKFVELCSYFSFFSIFSEIFFTFLNYDVTRYVPLFFVNV